MVQNFFAWAILFTAHTLALSPTENEIQQYISAVQTNQLDLLEKLVNINSGTTNIAGVQKVGEILRRQFAELGFQTHWVEEPPAFKRAGTLVAEKQGKGPKLLLIGHLDTVFPPENPFRRFERHGNFAIGPGVIDDKGSLVVLLYALKALQNTQHLDDINITVVLTGDEENSGKPASISRRPLFEAAKNVDVALDFEWAFALDTATIARRGITTWILQTRGQSAHSADIFQKSVGAGAIFELNRILNTMYNQLNHEKNLTFSPGILLGGSEINYAKNNSRGMASGKDNVVAQMALANGDLRYLTLQQKNQAENTILNIINQHLPQTTANIQFVDGIPSMAPTAANVDLLKKYSAVSMALGYGPVHALDPGLRGAGDISYIAGMVKANLAGLGAVGTSAHTEKETLNINSLPIETARAAVLIYHLTSVGQIEDPGK